MDPSARDNAGGMRRKAISLTERCRSAVSLCGCLLGALVLLADASSAADVDQVLVLYNKNWKHDAPGTAAGQDSEEVARYYVARHTDPETGKKPYVLGLAIPPMVPTRPGHAEHGLILRDTIPERSRDNLLGVVYRGRGKPMPAKIPHGGQYYYLLSTHVAVEVKPARVDWDTVTLKIAGSDEVAKARTVYSRSVSARRPAVTVSDLQPGTGRRFETSADRLGLNGDLYLWIDFRNKAGRVLRDERLRYLDFDKVVIPIPQPGPVWDTLAVDIWSPRKPGHRLRICEEGKSRVPTHVKVARGVGGGELVLRAAALGLRGDFMLGWSGRDAGGRPVKSDEMVIRDARRIAIDIVDRQGTMDWGSVRLRFSAQADAASAKTLYARGKSFAEYPIVHVSDARDPGGRRRKGVSVLTMNAPRAGFRGDLYVWITAKDRAGKVVLDRRARYFDPADLAVSRTGRDGVRDDANYLATIEKPVKTFLEDPANAVAGRSLKEHILYIVVCHGMPMLVRRTYGLAQSAVRYDVTGSGPRVDLGQRLEMMYYDIEAVRPLRLVPVHLPDQHNPFQTWTAVSSWWFPLLGRRVQPYLHPAAYGRRRSGGVSVPGNPGRFSPEARAKHPQQFLYVSSRIDARDPLNALAQIDAAEYAGVYLTPKIGSRPQGEWNGKKAMAGTANRRAVDLLKRLGLPGVEKQINRSVRFGLADDGSYCPGAVDWFVISGNGCDRPKSQVRRTLAAGVTVTGGAARAYRGCPHTTTHAWWDADVFYHFLFGGWDLGEAWLFSRYKLQWCTSFFGDPLYHPDLRKTRCDRVRPRVAKAADITVTPVPGLPQGQRPAVGVRAHLQTSRDNPEMVQAVVDCWPKGQPQAKKTVVELRYRRRPYVVLPGLKPATTYGYRLLLTDPYLNAFDSRGAFGSLTFRTPG